MEIGRTWRQELQLEHGRHPSSTSKDDCRGCLATGTLCVDKYGALFGNGECYTSRYWEDEKCCLHSKSTTIERQKPLFHLVRKHDTGYVRLLANVYVELVSLSYCSLPRGTLS